MSVSMLRGIMAIKCDKKKRPTSDISYLGKPAGPKATIKINKAFTRPMTTKELSIASGYCIPVVSVVTRFMRHYGDLITVNSVHTLTGTDIYLNQAKSKKPRSNTGVVGVSFNKKTKCFVCSHSRGVAYTFKTLLDAVCKRRSLELSGGNLGARL